MLCCFVLCCAVLYVLLLLCSVIVLRCHMFTENSAITHLTLTTLSIYGIAVANALDPTFDTHKPAKGKEKKNIFFLKTNQLFKEDFQLCTVL